MPPTFALAAILTLAVLLVIVSAIAGMLWARARSIPIRRAAQLARELGERQRALEELIERLERAGRIRPEAPARTHPLGPQYRADAPQPSAVTGPTLIAVPDLNAPTTPQMPSDAAAELAQRFGAVWDLAQKGHPAEAIARATGQPIGQVDLVLGLRRQLHAAEGRAAP